MYLKEKETQGKVKFIAEFNSSLNKFFEIFYCGLEEWKSI